MARYVNNLIDGGSEPTPRKTSTPAPAATPTSPASFRAAEERSMAAYNEAQTQAAALAAAEAARKAAAETQRIVAEEAAKKTALAEQKKAEEEAAATAAKLAALQKQYNTLSATISNITSQPAQVVTQATAGTTAAATAQNNALSQILVDRFSKYGLTSLAGKIRQLAIEGATEATVTIALQDSPEYQQRFAANQARIKKGLQVLSPSEYLTAEDSYRQVLRAYGLQQFDNDAYVQKFIANDISATEFSNRVATAVQRVQNADPAIITQLGQYYGIGQKDLVAYVLDPEQQLQKIQRQVSAAEIGVAAARQGLQPGVAVAEQLAAQGVDQGMAQKGYATIADILPTATKLSEIYGATLDTYGQAEAEQEVFNQLASAQRKRQKLTEREIAAFSGSSGALKSSQSSNLGGNF